MKGSGVATDFGSPVFGAWRAHARDHWQAYTRHRFVAGLGDGSLAHSAFLAYLEQDYLFLVQYSRAWAMAVVKADSVRQMRTAAAAVNALINEEIQLHIEACAREGITEAQLQAAREAPENVAYTRYVMDTALAGDVLDLLAVLAPCVFGYGEIGLALAAELENGGRTTPLYREWIETYSGVDYQGLCTVVADMLEDCARARIGADFAASPRWPALCSRFDAATALEVGFWDMGLRLG